MSMVLQTIALAVMSTMYFQCQIPVLNNLPLTHSIHKTFGMHITSLVESPIVLFVVLDTIQNAVNGIKANNTYVECIGNCQTTDAS